MEPSKNYLRRFIGLSLFAIIWYILTETNNPWNASARENETLVFGVIVGVLIAFNLRDFFKSKKLETQAK